MNFHEGLDSICKVLEFEVCFLGFPLRNGVVTGTSPRMTTKNSFYRKPSSFEQAMFSKCFQGILRTCGLVPTGSWGQRRYQNLIHPHQKNKRGNQYFFHSLKGSPLKFKRGDSGKAESGSFDVIC